MEAISIRFRQKFLENAPALMAAIAPVVVQVVSHLQALSEEARREFAENLDKMLLESGFARARDLPVPLEARIHSWQKIVDRLQGYATVGYPSILLWGEFKCLNALVISAESFGAYGGSILQEVFEDLRSLFYELHSYFATAEEEQERSSLQNAFASIGSYAAIAAFLNSQREPILGVIQDLLSQKHADVSVRGFLLAMAKDRESSDIQIAEARALMPLSLLTLESVVLNDPPGVSVTEDIVDQVKCLRDKMVESGSYNLDLPSEKDPPHAFVHEWHELPRELAGLVFSIALLCPGNKELLERAQAVMNDSISAWARIFEETGGFEGF